MLQNGFFVVFPELEVLVVAQLVPVSVDQIFGSFEVAFGDFSEIFDGVEFFLLLHGFSVAEFLEAVFVSEDDLGFVEEVRLGCGLFGVW